jgi:hypothetical protein
MRHQDGLNSAKTKKAVNPAAQSTISKFNQNGLPQLSEMIKTTSNPPLTYCLGEAEKYHTESFLDKAYEKP